MAKKKGKPGTPDWLKVRAEYESSQTSYRKLAAKYGVSAKTVERHSQKEGWRKARAEYRQEVSSIVSEKCRQRHADMILKDIDPALEATEHINRLVLEALQDTGQFYRHMVQKKESFTEAGVGGESKQWVETMSTSIIDAKRLQSLAQALKISKELQRLLQGEMDVATARKLEIERDKLKLDKDKSKTGSEGIVVKIEGEAEEWAE